MNKIILNFTLASIITFAGFAANAQTNLFARVYSIHGIKTHAGTIFQITDSSIQLKNELAIIPVKQIGFIKTKRSFGHNVLVSSIIVGTSLAILGALATNDSHNFFNITPAEGAAAGLIGGVSYGLLIGAGTTLLKHPLKFPINGSEKNWKEFQRYVNSYK